MKVGPVDPSHIASLSGVRQADAVSPAPVLTPVATTEQAPNAAAAGTQVLPSLDAASVQEISGSGSMDMDKVQRIRAAIADGSYRVDAEAIADRLIADNLEMLQRAAQR